MPFHPHLSGELLLPLQGQASFLNHPSGGDPCKSNLAQCLVCLGPCTPGVGQAGVSCLVCREAQDSVLSLQRSQVRRGSAAGPGDSPPQHRGHASPQAGGARRASRRLGPWRLQGNSTEGEGARRFRAERRPSSGSSVQEERVGRGNLAPLGRACPGSGAPLLRGPAGGTLGRAPPRGCGGKAGASPENDACGGRAGSAPRSQPPAPAFTALGRGANSWGAFSRTDGPSPGRPADCLPAECGARPRPGRARRGRILGPAAGSAGAAGPDTASQTGLAREHTREPRESLASPRGGRLNLRSRPSGRHDAIRAPRSRFRCCGESSNRDRSGPGLHLGRETTNRDMASGGRSGPDFSGILWGGGEPYRLGKRGLESCFCHVLAVRDLETTLKPPMDLETTYARSVSEP
ncbi:collagen alpha-1(I) chain-like [Lutra lutra]|uniref:collagen alpha-1(I) chain-like n=1 Tax=Lutra lutra TaxID=9657 RepID=UPI001FCFE471|nr:collagen alpha-1(I) chain-like [Lutra lutra]